MVILAPVVLVELALVFVEPAVAVVVLDYYYYPYYSPYSFVLFLVYHTLS